MEGGYGSVEKRTLYCHRNLGCDYTVFYDQDGTCLFEYPDTLRGNLFEAMTLLETADQDKLPEGVEFYFEKPEPPKGEDWKAYSEKLQAQIDGLLKVNQDLTQDCNMYSEKIQELEKKLT